jgi:hypothetical protein
MQRQRPNAPVGYRSGVPGIDGHMFWVRTLLLRRLGPLGIALTAYDLWRRVPRDRRRRIRAGARRRGARLVGKGKATAAKSARLAKTRAGRLG